MKPPILVPPASKSMAQRALFASALVPRNAGESTIVNFPDSDDVAPLLKILPACGVGIDVCGPGALRVRGPRGGRLAGGVSRERPLDCFVGESGTLCRLLTAVLACGRGFFRLRGAGRLHSRPLGALGMALRSLGAGLEYEGSEGFPPLLIEGRPRLRAVAAGGGLKTVALDSSESSQYLSGLLLAAPLLGGLRIIPSGRRVVSWPYAAMTLRVLRESGLEPLAELAGDSGWRSLSAREEGTLKDIKPGTLRLTVPGGFYAPADRRIEADWSGAAFLLAAGAVGPLPVGVSGLETESLQADREFLDIFRRMGAKTEWRSGVLLVFPSPLRGVKADLGFCPDLAPVLAFLAARAEGETVLENVGHLRLKESDRLEALSAELERAGCQASIEENGGGRLRVMPPGGGMTPGLARGRRFSSWGDHRIAMGLSLLGLHPDPADCFRVEMDGPACVSKSFPAFWAEMDKIFSAFGAVGI